MTEVTSVAGATRGRLRMMMCLRARDSRALFHCVLEDGAHVRGAVSIRLPFNDGQTRVSVLSLEHIAQMPEPLHLSDDRCCCGSSGTKSRTIVEEESIN